MCVRILQHRLHSFKPKRPNAEIVSSILQFHSNTKSTGTAWKLMRKSALRWIVAQFKTFLATFCVAGGFSARIVSLAYSGTWRFSPQTHLSLRCYINIQPLAGARASTLSATLNISVRLAVAHSVVVVYFFAIVGTFCTLGLDKIFIWCKMNFTAALIMYTFWFRWNRMICNHIRKHSSKRRSFGCSREQLSLSTWGGVRENQCVDGELCGRTVYIGISTELSSP